MRRGVPSNLYSSQQKTQKKPLFSVLAARPKTSVPPGLVELKRSSVVLPSRVVRCCSTSCSSVLFWYRKSTPKRACIQSVSLPPLLFDVSSGLRDGTRSRTLRSKSKFSEVL